MSGPGKGRYTDYVDTQSKKLVRLHKLYNKNPMSNNNGLLYGADLFGSNTSNNTVAAKFVVDQFTISVYRDYGYKNLVKYENKGRTSFVYFASAAPNTKNLADNIKDPPANSYIPNLSSPGANAGTGDITDSPYPNFKRDYDPQKDAIDPEKFKNYYIKISSDSIDDIFNLGTVSPSVASNFVGVSSIGSDLVMGSSKRD